MSRSCVDAYIDLAAPGSGSSNFATGRETSAGYYRLQLANNTTGGTYHTRILRVISSPLSSVVLVTMSGTPVNTRLRIVGDTLTAVRVSDGAVLLTATDSTFQDAGDWSTSSAGDELRFECLDPPPGISDVLTYPGTIEFSTGYDFGDSREVVAACRHQFVGAEISDDDLYITLTGQSFAAALEKGIFLKGRYDPLGIPASTLVEEILSDVDFVERGWWNYILGEVTCVASTTLPLGSDSGFDYWHIDAALEDINVYLPIPPVSHREALTMLAAYTGAYIFCSRDGSIRVTTTFLTSEG